MANEEGQPTRAEKKDEKDKPEAGPAKAEAKADKAEPKADKAEPKADKGEPKADKGEPKADKAEPKADKGEASADEAKAKADEAEAKVSDGEAPEAASEGAAEKSEEDGEEADDGDDKAGAEGEKAEGDKPRRAPRRARPAVPAAPPKKEGWGTTAGIISLIILVGGALGAIFIARRNEAANNAANQPKARAAAPDQGPPWKLGDKPFVVLTVLANDADELACASSQEIAGRHCGFEDKDTVWSKDDGKDDTKVLRPYATTGRRRLIGSGLWAQEAMKGTLPEGRFTVKCKFEIEGKFDKPLVRFKKDQAFKEVKEPWFTGNLTECTLLKKG